VAGAGARLVRRRARRADAGEQRARLVHRVRALQLLLEGLARAQALDVPGVELAQVAARAIRAQVLLHAVHDPRELVEDLVGGRLASRRPRTCSNSHGLPIDPRASMTAAAPVRS
jgi:hypothetical protein